jgi:hypothetical protein
MENSAHEQIQVKQVKARREQQRQSDLLLFRGVQGAVLHLKETL